MVQKLSIFFLIVSCSLCAMDVEKPSSKMVIAAWLVTPSTELGEYDQIIIQRAANGCYGIKHFSRPHGMRETRCAIKDVLELEMASLVQALTLKQTNDELTLKAVKKPWYQRGITTHAATVLGTALLVAALLH